MKADYKIGICFSNDDPNNLGRIRAITIDVLKKAASLKDIQDYVNKQDEKAIATLLYNPWYSTKYQNFRERDKYVCEPFLPKNIALTPNPGQLVKIITYEDLSQKTEFIGPYTIDQINLNEEYRNVVNNLQKVISLSEVLPKKGKTFFSGYSNEQIILGENELLIRLNHINDSSKTRKTSYPFIQLSQFFNSYNIKEKTTTITESPDVNIDYICELVLNYNNNTYIAEIYLYDVTKKINTRGEIGLTKNTYNPKEIYLTTDDFIVKHTITTKNKNDLIKTIDNIISGYGNGGVIKFYDTNTLSEQKNNTLTITVDNRNNQPNSGGAINDPNIISGIKNWLFRITPIRNTNTNLDSLIEKYRVDKEYGDLAVNKTTTTTITSRVPESANKPQSVYTAYSDKFLFLSSLNSLNIIDNFNFDGIPPNKIAEFLSGLNPNIKTYGFLRGEKMMELLVEVLDMFAKHGHEAGKDPRASIIQSTQEAVENLKKKIKDELKEGQNNVIINHNLRLN